ncbi:response regulator transcription factor [Synechococcus sp. CS-1325]|uniref:winged helix-turn-helix transcriptional regulator n=1 Tax=unclassified Synechococcus TaxID=2626047 RepID=UPI000DB8406A|nr:MULTISPECIES: response regulator transcription factor [unclassified Synechococcus]MCT0198217.1 response regulator transcription factor [Synechococcus sp. CS-1325]MCT0229533.1 response regulator transcription factor [Synechococcus sp. CS-1324]PZU99148.1 MAG: DNA-binding response regulator [Cyanobium sp.]PZV03509.1 MAG: DNA-binding response regulator [Cyanobium sp.]
MSRGEWILLVGPQAEARADRLLASGYRVARLGSLLEPPLLALLSGEEARALLPTLRLTMPELALLLDIGSDSVAGRSECLQAGADDFWLSSAGSSDLLSRVRLHLQLGSHRSPPRGVIQVADLRVDTGSREVRRGSRLINLTAREYQLLMVLLLHVGEVLSREQILREAWGDQPEPASNVVEVYVRYLRQKLEEQGERRLIHTLRGQGYCLCDSQPPARSAPGRTAP